MHVLFTAVYQRIVLSYRPDTAKE